MLKPKIALVKVSSDAFGGIEKKEKRKKSIMEQIQSYPPLGLCYLEAYLNSKGITYVEIIDCVEREYTSTKCAEYIVKRKFDVVGISATSFSLKSVDALIKQIRQREGEITIILGGVHVTYHPEIIKVVDADYGIRGDGEESFFNFLTNFSHGINGLVYKENGEVRYNKPAKISNLDTLPFPSIINHKYKFPFYNGKIYTMITSRGCPYDCIFCGLPHKGVFRKRSAENVFSELEFLKQKGYDYIDFKDDCFSFERERVVELCNFIIKSKLKISWGTEVRADLVDYDLLELMKEAGCHNLKFGIESGVLRIRNEIIGKKLSDEAIFDLVKWCRKLKIKSVGYVLFGLPTESLKEMEQTIKFIRKLDLDFMDILLSVIIPGSRLYEEALSEKKIKEEVWEEIAEGNGQPPIYIPERVSLKDMMSLQSRAYRNFYSNPVRIFNEIKSIRSLDKLISRLRFIYNVYFGRLLKY